MRVLQISDSQLGTWYDCRRRYHYEKQLRFRIIADKPDYMQEGSLIHKMLEVFYRLGIPREDGVRVTYSDRIEAGLDAAVKHASMADDINIEADRLQFLKDSFVLYADHWKEDGWIPRAVEHPFTMELYRRDDTDKEEGILVLYEGITDLLIEVPNEPSLIPVDHKSSSSFKKLRHPTLLSGQFIGYAVATDATKVVENKFGLQKTYGPKDRFIRNPIEYDPHVLEEWKGWTVVQALQLDRATQEDYFEPNFNACKRGCVFTSVCYTRPSLRDWKLTKDYIIAPSRSGKEMYKNDTE